MRARTPKMLVFPGLGSRPGMLQSRPGNQMSVEQHTVLANPREVNIFLARYSLGHNHVGTAAAAPGCPLARSTTALSEKGETNPLLNGNVHIRRVNSLVSVIRINILNRKLVRSRPRQLHILIHKYAIHSHPGDGLSQFHPVSVI